MLMTLCCFPNVAWFLFKPCLTCLIDMHCVLDKLLIPLNPIIYAGFISSQRLNIIATKLGFVLVTSPSFTWCLNFQRQTQKRAFSTLADKIKGKLASWKASLLSFARRLFLVKIVSFMECWCKLFWFTLGQSLFLRTLIVGVEISSEVGTLGRGNWLPCLGIIVVSLMKLGV